MDFKKLEKRIDIICAVFSVVVCAGYFIIKGIDLYFMAGLAAGTIVVLLNFHLLKITMDRFFSKKDRAGAAGIYIVRLVIFGAVGVACYKGGMICLIAYAVGVMGILVGILVGFSKGGNADD